MMNKFLKNKKGQAFTNFLTGELVDEILEGALTLITLGLGLNYFSIENNWLTALQLFAEKIGISINTSEISMMAQTVNNTFPFTLFSAKTLTGAIIAGIVIFVFGFVIKVILTKSKGELIKDMGKVITVPAIIGVVSLIFIYIMSASSLQNFFAQTSTSFEGQLGGLSSGLLIWQTMGVMFLIGLFGIIFGMILTSVIRSMGSRPLLVLIFGKFLTFIGFVSLGYYIIVRILAIPAVADTLIGEQLIRLFVLLFFMSKNGFIGSLVMFGFGMEMYKYGKFMTKVEEKIKKREKVLQRPTYQEKPQQTYQQPSYHPPDYQHNEDPYQKQQPLQRRPRKVVTIRKRRKKKKGIF